MGIQYLLIFIKQVRSADLPYPYVMYE